MNLRKIAQWLLMIVAVGIFFSGMILAQDEAPTDRPFPTPVAAPTDRPFPTAASQPTDRPFPTVAVTQASINAESTEVLSVGDAIATANSAQAQVIELQAEIDGLRSELDVATSDTGATTYAIVIVLVGIILGLGVLFGLRGGAR